MSRPASKGPMPGTVPVIEQVTALPSAVFLQSTVDLNLSGSFPAMVIVELNACLPANMSTVFFNSGAGASFAGAAAAAAASFFAGAAGSAATAGTENKHAAKPNILIRVIIEAPFGPAVYHRWRRGPQIFRCME